MSTSSEFRNFFDPWKNEPSPLFASGLNNNGPTVINALPKVRLAFVRKVYSILSVQLGLTAVVSLAVMNSPSVQLFLVRK